ncbi:MAG: SUMF1/EgtB/PvdO family nonheme iron enzyme [Deltaproteobacteria bacterium]
MTAVRRQDWLTVVAGAVAAAGLMQCARPATLPPPASWSPPVQPLLPCPDDMAEVPGESGIFCVDRYEAALVRRQAGGKSTPWPSNKPVDGSESEVIAVSRAAQKPQGYISGVQATLACQQAGKRLCLPSEWQAACRGPEHTRYPYGDTRRAGVCNDRFDKPTEHPVTRLFELTKKRGDHPAQMWTPSFMNDPRLHELPSTVTSTGAFSKCTNAYGVFDMVGNLHEWVADPKGTFMGGFFMDTRLNGEGCAYRTTAHDFGYHDYSTGFRCCADAGKPRP